MASALRHPFQADLADEEFGHSVALQLMDFEHYCLQISREGSSMLKLKSFFYPPRKSELALLAGSSQEHKYEKGP